MWAEPHLLLDQMCYSVANCPIFRALAPVDWMISKVVSNISPLQGWQNKTEGYGQVYRVHVQQVEAKDWPVWRVRS